MVLLLKREINRIGQRILQMKEEMILLMGAVEILVMIE